MIKPDEIEFMRFVLSNKGKIPGEFWAALTKRQHALLNKWARKGFWDYGTSTRGGWITEQGKRHFILKG